MMYEKPRIERTLVVILSIVFTVFASVSSVQGRKVPRKPITCHYYTPDSTYILEVVPSVTGMMHWREATHKCKGRFFHKMTDGTLDTLWDKDLPNFIAPDNAIISETGKYIITFNEWDQHGYGENVVVVYDRKGNRINRLALTDIYSQHDPDYWQSSLNATGITLDIEDSPIGNDFCNTGNRIDERKSLLYLYVPPDYRAARHSQLTMRDTVKVNLATGKVITPIIRKATERKRTADTSWTRTFQKVITAYGDTRMTAEASEIGIELGLENRFGYYSGVGHLTCEGTLTWIGESGDWYAGVTSIQPLPNAKFAVLCYGYADIESHRLISDRKLITFLIIDTVGTDIFHTDWGVENTHVNAFGQVFDQKMGLMVAGVTNCWDSSQIKETLTIKRLGLDEAQGGIIRNWYYVYPQFEIGQGLRIVSTTDENILISGGETGQLGKFNWEGKLLWMVMLDFEIVDLIAASNGGCDLVGLDKKSEHYCLLRIDSDGQVLSNLELDLRDSDKVRRMIATQNGGYAFAVKSQRFSEDGEFMLLIADSLGHVLNELQAGTIWDEEPYGLKELEDGFMMAGTNDIGIYAVRFKLK